MVLRYRQMTSVWLVVHQGSMTTTPGDLNDAEKYDVILEMEKILKEQRIPTSAA